jgi:hypothetical protein
MSTVASRLGLLTAGALLLAGCGESRPYADYEHSAAKRSEAFKECMAAVPAGPQTTTYNDWDEVVNECRAYADIQSRRCVRHCDNQLITPTVD